MDVALELDGNIVSGLSILRLKLTGNAEIQSLTIGNVTLDYQLGHLLKGQINSLTIDNLHADVRLGLEKPDEPKKPFDLDALIHSLALARNRVLPVLIELRQISFSATKDGKCVIALAPSRVMHDAASETFKLELGALTDATDKEWPAQSVEVKWQEKALSVDRLDPLPGISIRDLVLQTPPSGQASLETELHIGDAILVVATNPGFTEAKIDLREGAIDIPTVTKRLGLEIPAAAVLTSFSVVLADLLPDPAAATGSAQILLEDVRWQDWSASELSLDAFLGKDQGSLLMRALALGTEILINAKAPIEREKQVFLLGETEGQFKVLDFPKLVAAMGERFPQINRESRVPPSTVDGSFKVGFEDNLPSSANALITLAPTDEKRATAVNLTGKWQRDVPVSGELVVDGLKASGQYQIDKKSYEAAIEFADFSTERIAPWLEIAKIKLAGAGRIDGSWTGSGEISPAQHRGSLTLTKGEWAGEAAPLISGIGAVSYEWPGTVEASGVRVQMNEQVVAMEAELLDETLVLKRFAWTDGDKQIAEGTANLPMPKDFSKWREMLSRDTRSLNVSIRSEILSLGLIKEWVPAAEKLDPRSTGQLNFSLKGTYAAPEIDALFEAKDLRSPAQPKLPPADLKVTIIGRDNNLVVTATATAADFPPAELKAAMPFRPSEWAEKPALFLEEPVKVRLDLPRLDLSRFTSLVPDAQKISGSLTGNVVVAGNIKKPDMRGEINLAGGSFQFKNERFPAVESINGAVGLLLDRVTLKNLKAMMAGGTINAAGSLAISGGKPGDLDFKVRGDHLPLLRNDLLVLRSNFDLSLRGQFETAVVSGTGGVVDSVFYREIELLPIGAPFNAPSAAALPKIDVNKQQGSLLPEPFRNWGLNVTVRMQDPFLIRGNLARGEVNGSVKVGGTLGTPLPDGQLILTDFKASLPFSTLTIPAGKITFTPGSGLDPILEIRGFAEPRPYRVTVYAHGKLSSPQLVLTSNPPLPDNEIMTLLATGTTTSGLEDPQVASSRAIQLLAEELRRGRFVFGKQLRPLVGLLDRVDFSLAEADPYSDASFSTATIALTDRWYVAAGLDEEGDSRAMVIWRLSFR